MVVVGGGGHTWRYTIPNKEAKKKKTPLQSTSEYLFVCKVLWKPIIWALIHHSINALTHLEQVAQGRWVACWKTQQQQQKKTTAAELLPEPPIKGLIMPLLMTEELKPLINSAEM